MTYRKHTQNIHMEPVKKHVIAGVWADHYTTHKLPVDLYKKTGKRMGKALKEGYQSTVKFGAADHAMIKALNSNTWFFSAAKTYQTVRGMQATKEALRKTSEILVDETGEKISTFRAFRDGYVNKNGDYVPGVSQLYDDFNVAWLETEYQTAIGAAMGASRWLNVVKNKDILPYLRFNGVGDGVECDICMPLDGITLPVDDPFWTENWPGTIHWRCRCSVEQLSEADDITGGDDITAALGNSDDAGRQNLFKFNPGIDKVVFQTDGEGKHPYFAVAKGDNNLLNNNFNLPKQ